MTICLQDNVSNFTYFMDWIIFKISWNFLGFTVTRICHIFLHSTFKEKNCIQDITLAHNCKAFSSSLQQDRVLHSIYLLVFVEEAEQRSDKVETILLFLR